MAAASRTSTCETLHQYTTRRWRAIETHLGITEEVTQLVHQFCDDVLLEEEEVVEVEHCRSGQRSSSARESGRGRTLKGPQDVQPDTPTRRVLEQADELRHEGSSESTGEGQASDGDDELLGSSSQLVVVEHLLHAEELWEELGDEGEDGGDAVVGGVSRHPGEDCKHVVSTQRTRRRRVWTYW